MIGRTLAPALLASWVFLGSGDGPGGICGRADADGH
jgi:hypothetical protein